MWESELKRWLDANKLIVNTKTNLTHVMMDGGKGKISTDKIHEFFSIYAKSYLKSPYFICEQVDNIRKFYCDFDIEYSRPLTLDDLEPYTKKMYEIIYKYFRYDSTIIICLAPYKDLEDGNIKTGIHYIWKDFFVNKSVSIVLAKFFIQEFKLMDSEESLDEASKESLRLDWESIVDLQVYNTGLRMIGSNKMYKKKDEHGRDKFVAEYRKYMPSRCYPEDKEYIENGDMFKFLCDCSVRNLYGGEESVPKERIPVVGGKDTTVEMDDVIENAELKMEAIRELIRISTCPKQWDAPFTSFKFINNNYILYSKSRYCLNNGKEHNGKSVFFQISKMGLIQRCTCMCKGLKNGKKMECSKYRSKKYKLSKDAFRVLYPDQRAPSKKYLLNIDYYNMFPNNTILSYDNIDEYLIKSKNTIDHLKNKYC